MTSSLRPHDVPIDEWSIAIRLAQQGRREPRHRAAKRRRRCVHCWTTAKPPGAWRCDPCRLAHNAYKARLREDRKVSSLCVACAAPLDADATNFECPVCYGRRRKNRRKARRRAVRLGLESVVRERRKRAAWSGTFRGRHREAGTCIGCSGEARHDRLRCGPCTAAVVEENRLRRYAKRAGRKFRGAADVLLADVERIVPTALEHPARTRELVELYISEYVVEGIDCDAAERRVYRALTTLIAEGRVLHLGTKGAGEYQRPPRKRSSPPVTCRE